MIFPLRNRFLKNHPDFRLALYVPAALLFLARLRMHLPLGRPWTEAGALRLQDSLERLELLHYALFALITLAILGLSTRRAPNILLKKQLRIIVYGLGFGVLPSTVFYAVPFIAGSRPSTGGELTVLLQALIPLVFSYSISRYRLVDIEVVLKKAATLTFSFFVIASLYLFVSSRTGLFSGNRLNAIILGILAMIFVAVGIVLVKPMLAGVEIFWATGVRLVGGTLGVLAYLPFLPKRREILRPLLVLSNWRAMVPASFLGSFLSLLFWMGGMKFAFASVAAILNQMCTIFIFILAALFLGEKATRRKIVAVILAFIGAFLAAYPF
jgi:drug/metabolite transporter (DMT)-like permease